jgi:low temperature requirement protein LtrA
VSEGQPIREFRRWFWRPPRAHGEVIVDRRVSYLELLYDLVYVAVVSQATTHLAQDISVSRVIEFAILFGLIWIAWVNGTLFLELHGREDGRTRSFVFLQMGIVALLAVFTASAATTGGAQFAITYAAFLAVQAWLFGSVSRLDSPEVARVTKGYAVGLVVGMALFLGSAALEPGLRVMVWGAFVGLWVLTMIALSARNRRFTIGIVPTESMVERFDLFTIIVLGELIIQVVAGMSHAEQDLITVGTGILALGIGLGFWWLYFDIVGRRLPRNEGKAIGVWILAHLPVVMAIAAAGASMEGLIEHAHEAAAPDPVLWLLAGAIGAVLIFEIVEAWSLHDVRRMAAVYRPVAAAMIVAAAAVLALGLLRPAAWVFALIIGALLTVLWLFAAIKFIRSGAWSAAD